MNYDFPNQMGGYQPKNHEHEPKGIPTPPVGGSGCSPGQRRTRGIFCVGFLFNRDMTHVALVHKRRPAWQVNRMNGIGGSLEFGETALDAQRREFREETSLRFEDWERVGTMDCETAIVEVFRGFLRDNDMPDLFPEARDDGKEQEDAEWVEVDRIRMEPYRFIHNVDWLVRFCLDTKGFPQNLRISYTTNPTW